MDMTTALSFALLAALLVVSPGPNGLLVAKSLATAGAGAAWGNIAGFVVAFYLHGTLALLGFSVLIMQSATAFFIFKLLGAAYLCWIGLRALWEAWRHAGQPHAPVIARGAAAKSRWAAVLEGFLTNALNPKVSVFYLAAFPQFLPADTAGATAGFALVSLHAAINALWFGAMIVLASQITRVAVPTWVQRWLKGATGAIFIGFGVKLALYRP